MKKKIIVVGDVILDRYIYGNVTKISQESPTAVVNIDPNLKDHIIPGGAANVAANICKLEEDVELYTMLGNDTNSIITKKIFKKKKIKLEFVNLKKYKVTEKIRIISNNQQIIRLDKDSPKIKYEQKLLEKKLNKNLNKINYLIISDYNKGTIQNLEKIINLANKNNVRVLIDSKIENISAYKNSYLIKPNQKEFEKMFNIKVDEKDTNLKIISLLKKFNISFLLLTLGKDGMKLFSKNWVKNFDSNAKDVFDVTGAGDTVLASLAVSLNKNKNILDSVKFALKAAEIAISKFGTSVVNLEEIEQKEKKNKIIKIKDLPKVLSEQSSQNKKIVFTNGCFDLLHSGHLHLLKAAKKFGDILVVGLNSDKSVQYNKGFNRPIVNEKDRAEHLASLEFVDYVIIYENKTPERLIKKINPDILVKGNDYKNKFIAGKKHVLKNKGRVKLIEKYKDYSTTKIISSKK